MLIKKMKCVLRQNIGEIATFSFIFDLSEDGVVLMPVNFIYFSL